MIKFEDFLQQTTCKKFWSTKNTICFYGQDYSSLFFNKLFKKLNQKEILPAQYKNLLIDSTDQLQLQSSLQQTFLGQKKFYWLGEHVIKKTTKTNLLDFFTSYKGPHFIAFFINEEKITATIKTLLKKISTIEIDNNIDEKTFKKILKLFDKNFSNEKLKFASKFFNQEPLGLDQICMLIQYLELTKIKIASTFEEYLKTTIFQMQPSLILLSQYFFAKKANSFFSIWNKIHNEYPEMFWVSFWSEQIWKAYYVVKFLKEKNFTKARRMSFRLPFSFINKDWRNFYLNDLAKQYQFLYNNDFKLKRGSTFCFLELFYTNHFNKQGI